MKTIVELKISIMSAESKIMNGVEQIIAQILIYLSVINIKSPNFK